MPKALKPLTALTLKSCLKVLERRNQDLEDKSMHYYEIIICFPEGIWRLGKIQATDENDAIVKYSAKLEQEDMPAFYIGVRSGPFKDEDLKTPPF